MDTYFYRAKLPSLGISGHFPNVLNFLINEEPTSNSPLIYLLTQLVGLNYFKKFKNIPPTKVILLFHISKVSGIHNLWRPFTKLFVFEQNKISETSTIFQDFLSDHNSFQWNLNINLLVNILNFCLLMFLVFGTYLELIEI